MMNEGRLDEGKMSCARAWKVSIVLTAAVACLSILHSSFYNVSSDRFFSSTKSTSFREAKTTPASRSDDSKLAKSGSALVDSGSVMMATTYKSMCVHIGSQSAFSLWKLHAAQILKASQLPADPQFAQHDMMLEMLNKISPRLPHSHQSLTRAWKTVEHVLSVAWERYQYLQHIKNPVTSTLQRKEPPLVRIVVVGGSVTLGHKCSAINDVKEIPCSWVARLETLLNGLAGGALVQVHNSAIGASTSETGQAIWDHEILPDEAKNPDILINAYSTNDSHPSRGTRDKKSAMAQSFVRSILTPLTCSKPPLLIWLDDYIGNVAQGIKEMTLLSQEVQVLANYYGFSFVSFANVVRDWVYGDNHGTLFTPPWYSADGQFVTEVHPGQGMHIATMWIMAYNFLNLATTHCSVVNWSSQTNHNSAGSSFMHPFNTSDQIKIPESTYYQPVPSSLPPALTDALTLKDVTDMWRNDARALEKNPKVCSPNRTSRCIFSWVSGLEWQESIATIQKKFAPFVVEQGKWRVIDDTGRRKFGWVPAEKGSKLLFEFQNLTQTVRTVTLFPMKSYGEKWRNSNARFRFLSKSNEAMDWLELTSLEIPGLHSTTTSEIYTIPVHMPSEIPANSNLRISMTMTNGTTYKLMGLTVCS
jgi:hypothetical protein